MIAETCIGASKVSYRRTDQKVLYKHALEIFVQYREGTYGWSHPYQIAVWHAQVKVKSQLPVPFSLASLTLGLRG